MSFTLIHIFPTIRAGGDGDGEEDVHKLQFVFL